MDAADQVLLEIEGGPHDSESIPLEGSVITMGRQASNEVVVAEAGVSRRHAEIAEVDGSYYLKDLASTNGTAVNGKKVPKEAEHLLHDGDSIRLGASKVLYVFRSPASSTLAITLEQPAIQEDGDETGPVDVVTRPVSPMTIATELPLIQEGAEAGDCDEEYEGDVLLNIKVIDGGMGLVVSFVQQLREREEFRVPRMENNDQGGVDLALKLREPLALRKVLAEMDGVAQVTQTAGGAGIDEPVLAVILQPVLAVILQEEDTASSDSVSTTSCVHCKQPLERSAAVCPHCRKSQA